MNAPETCLLACELPAECDRKPDAALIGKLAPDLREWVLGKRRARDQWASVVGRLLLMEALRALGAANVRLGDLGRRPDNSPMIPPPFAGSIAHTTEMVVAAAASRGAIGVDLEAGARARRHADEVATFFTASERSVLQGDREGWRMTFVEIWTRKEALAKASGRPLDVVFGQPVMEDALTFDGRAWNLSSLPLARDHCCAIAWDHRPLQPAFSKLALASLVG